MRNTSEIRTRINRRMMLTGLAGLAVGTAGLATPALALGRGDYRRLRLLNPRTDEWLDTIYWADGSYIPEAVEAVDFIMRDWRQDAVRPIARETLDLLSQTYRKLDCSEPIAVVSGYRTPKTNAMLRRRSSGVAKNSYHVRAMAVDLTLKSRSVRQIAGAAESLGGGGVGRYSRSEFVHIDCGPVRTWGR